MKTARLAMLAFARLMVGCNSASKLSVPANPVRAYNGTASLGDFLTIAIDSNKQTITYKNQTNGESGTVPYPGNADGTCTIADPHDNLLSAQEAPGTMLMVEAANAGPGRDTAALITAVESVPATINTFAGRDFICIQFRTAGGGMAIGTITIDSQGNTEHDGYWPFGAFSQSPFNSGSFSASSVHEDHPAGSQ